MIECSCDRLWVSEDLGFAFSVVVNEYELVSLGLYCGFMN